MWDFLKQFLYENILGTAEKRISVLENGSEEIIQNADERDRLKIQRFSDMKHREKNPITYIFG